MLPKTFNAAVAAGLAVLTSDARKELAEVGFVDPHTKYRIDFEKVVANALGLNDGSNQELLIDVARNHADALNFLESDEHRAEPQAVLRIVLAEMARAVQGE
ncbi:hypothetical protein LJR028_004201 [Rhizobacter sp. LjRoot28]